MEKLAEIALPADAPQKKGPDRNSVKHRLTALINTRKNYEERWKDIRDYQLPFIGEFGDTGDAANKARRKDLMIANGTAWLANLAFSAGIMSGLTPPSRQWFKFSFSNSQNEDIEAGRVLDKRQEIVEYILHRSNFYNSVHACYMELAHGQAPLGVFASSETGVRFQNYTIGTYYLSNGAHGAVAPFCREGPMTADQLLDQFGENNLPQTVKDALQNESGRYNKQFKTYWMVCPNKYRTVGKPGRSNMPYSSLYWIANQAEDSGFLYTGGFEEFPVPTARYQVIEGSPYGKGPGWYAEGDAKMLQMMKKDLLTTAELMVKPPMKGPADVGINGGVNLIPGGYTHVNNMTGNNAIEPLFQVPTNPQWLAQEIMKTEESIKRIYSADLFLMLDAIENKQMTAREVMERQQEKLQQLGPVVERMQDEFLSPIIERCYNIAERMGIFEPLPEELAERIAEEEIKIEYISPLAQAQKMSGLVNIEQAVSFVSQMAQIYPEALKSVDPIGTIKRYFNLLGAPAVMQRSKEEIDKLIQAEKEAMREQEEQEYMMRQAQAMAPAAQAAKNLTEAAQDGNPALQNLLGLGG